MKQSPAEGIERIIRNIMSCVGDEEFCKCSSEGCDVYQLFIAAALRSPISLLRLFPSINVATFRKKFFIHKLANTLAMATIGLLRNNIAAEAARPMQAFWSFLITRRLFLHLVQYFAWFS